MEASNFSVGSLSPNVAKAMRRPVLQELSARGAMSISELVATPIKFLNTSFERDEIEVLLDSARRNQLIVQLEDKTRPDGSSIEEPEWSLTDRGRNAASGFGAWAAGLGGKARNVIAGVISLGSAAGVGKLLAGLDIPAWVIGLTVLIITYVALMVLAIVWRRVQGASDTAVAEQWPNLYRKHRAEYDLVFQRKRWIKLAGPLIVAVYVLELVGMLLSEPWANPGTWRTVAGLVLTMVGFALLGIIIWSGAKLSNAEKVAAAARVGTPVPA